MNNNAGLKHQIEELLKSVQIHFPKNGQKLIVYLLFYKRFCALVQDGYFTKLSSVFIKNDLTQVSTNSKNGKHIFKTLFNFNTSLSIALFNHLKEFTASIKNYNEADIGTYNIRKERKFETILYYLFMIDTDILNISIKDFGILFKEILLIVYKNEFYDNKVLHELLINISQLNSGKVFINNPKLGNIVLDTLPVLDNDYSKFYIHEEKSFVARMSLIMNGFYSFNFSNKNVSTVIVDDKMLHSFDKKNLLSTINDNLTLSNSVEQLLLILPIKKIEQLEFNDALLKKLVSVIKFDKRLGILIFRKKWDTAQNNLLIINRFFDNELQHDIITTYKDFFDKKSIQENNHFRIEKFVDVQKNGNKIELNEKEPKSLNQSINDNLERIDNHIQTINKIEDFKINENFEAIKAEFSDIKNSLSGKIILPKFEDHLQWENLFIFFKNEVKNLITDKIKVVSNFQNLTLLDLKINTSLFRNLLKYIDYQLKSDDKCRIEFSNLIVKKKVRISFFATNNCLLDDYIEQLQLLAEIHGGLLKLEKKKDKKDENFYKLAIIEITYNDNLNHRTIEKLVRNEMSDILEKKKIYIISDEIGNENIIRGLNIKDIINNKSVNINNEEKLSIQKLRFQSSLEMFLQLNQELTVKRTFFKLELPSNEVIKDYIFQEIKNRHWRHELEDSNNLIAVYLKASSPPSPSKIVDFFNKFHDSKRLKYITHDYDVPNSKFDYDVFLREAEEEFETIIQTIGIHQNLEILIREFAFRKPSDRIVGKSNVGWRDDAIREWCVKNPNRHPINNSEFSNVFDDFKNRIEVREKHLVKRLEESIKKKLGEAFAKAKISFNENIEFTTFYTDVEQVFSGIRDLFAPIKERIIENPHIDISVEDHFENINSASIELIILHRNSFAEKIEDERILFGADLSTAKRKFEGFCDWAIESRFKNGYYRLNILNDKEIPKKESIDENSVKGFSHHLTFYI